MGRRAEGKEPGPRERIRRGEKDKINGKGPTPPGAVGRPRTRLEDLDPNWKEIMMLAAQEGDGPTGYMVKLGIGNTVMNTLLEDYEEFRDTYEACRLLCQLWWETTGKTLAKSGGGSAAVWAMNMTNRFGWKSQRNEVVGDPTAPLGISNADKKPLSKEEIIAECKKRGLPTQLLIEHKD